MPRKRRPSLMAELARLVVEYPEKDWKIIVDRLRDREFMEDLSASIEGAVNIASKSVDRRSAKRNASEHLGNVLKAIAKQDPEKAQFLTILKSRLNDRSNVVSLAEIRAFASSMGMKDKLPSRRPEAVNRIIRHLAQKPTEEIEAALRVERGAYWNPNEGYDRWVDLILGSGAKFAQDKDSMSTDEDR